MNVNVYAFGSQLQGQLITSKPEHGARGMYVCSLYVYTSVRVYISYRAIYQRDMYNYAISMPLLYIAPLLIIICAKTHLQCHTIYAYCLSNPILHIL